jgi:hypothetical protein
MGTERSEERFRNDSYECKLLQEEKKIETKEGSTPYMSL